jgi:hypothetical protein
MHKKEGSDLEEDDLEIFDEFPGGVDLDDDV